MALRAPWLLLLLVACPKRGNEHDRELLALLAQADAAWLKRGELGLEQSSAPLLQAWGHDPSHIGVAWRLARLKIAEGIVADDPNVARSAYADARALAMGCLQRDMVFAQQREESGWDVALDKMSIASKRCAAWGALGWTRWMAVTGGAATAIDLDAVSSLVQATTSTDEELTNDIGTWAGGVLAAVRPPWSGGSIDDAKTSLQKAIDQAPDELVRQADLYTLVLEPTDDPEAPALKAQILAATAVTPEDQAVQRHLSEAPAAKAAEH